MVPHANFANTTFSSHFAQEGAKCHGHLVECHDAQVRLDVPRECVRFWRSIALKFQSFLSQSSRLCGMTTLILCKTTEPREKCLYFNLIYIMVWIHVDRDIPFDCWNSCILWRLVWTAKESFSVLDWWVWKVSSWAVFKVEHDHNSIYTLTISPCQPPTYRKHIRITDNWRSIASKPIEMHLLLLSLRSRCFNDCLKLETGFQLQLPARFFGNRQPISEKSNPVFLN